jgi:hypothetical protein
VPSPTPRSVDAPVSRTAALGVSPAVLTQDDLYGVVQVLAEDGAPEGPASVSYVLDGQLRSARVGTTGEAPVVLSGAGRVAFGADGDTTLWHVHEAAYVAPSGDTWTPAPAAVRVWSLGPAVVVQTPDALWVDRGTGSPDPLLALSDGAVGVAACGPAADPAARVVVVANGGLHLFERSPSGRYARVAHRIAVGAVAEALDVADWDGDGQRDVVVSWAATEGGPDTVEAWSPSVGRWSIVDRFDVAAGGLAGAGVFARRDGEDAVLEVIPAAGGWRRWQRRAGGAWQEAVEVPLLDIAAGTEVVGGLPLLGSAARDLVLVGPLEPLTSDRVVRFLDLDRYPASVIEVRSAGAAWAISPAAGAVAEALWTREPDGAARVFAAGLTGPTQWSLAAPVGLGPLVGVSRSGDAVPDLWSDDGLGWGWTEGADVGAAAPWARAALAIVPLADGVRGFDVEPVVSGAPALSALVTTGDAVTGYTVRRYTVDDAASTTVDRARVALPTGLGAMRDTALCAGVLWWLGEGGLQAITAGPTLRLGAFDPAAAGAVDVACAPGLVAVVGPFGGRLLDASGALVDASSTPAAGVALLDARPADTWAEAVVTCPSAGCLVGAWPDPAAPASVSTEADGSSTWREADGRVGRVPWSGASSFQDLDGDGRLDWTVLAPDGRLGVVRRTTAGPGALEVWRLPRPSLGAVAAVDLDLDGRRETLTLSAEGLWYVTPLSGGGVTVGPPGDTGAAPGETATP